MIETFPYRGHQRRQIAFGVGIAAGLAAVAAGGGMACSDNAAPAPMPPVNPVMRPWDLAGVVGTGQSLSVGDHGNPPSTTQQPFGNLKLSLGTATAVPPFDPALPDLTLVPLVEPIRALANSYPSAYPRNIYGETPHTAMANQVTALVQATAAATVGADAGAAGDYVTVHSVVGESGQPMSVINKTAIDMGSTGRAYAATLFEAGAIKRLADAMGKTYGVGAIILTHGESDSGSARYGADLFQLWSDYNQDLAAITGQTAKIPLLVSQQNAVPPGMGMTSVSTVAQWKAGVDHPGDIVCVGPKYQYSYATDATRVHLNPREYQRLGEKFGQVYFERVVLGHDWQPLQPISAEVSGNVINVRFHVPVAPLVWDDTLPPPHGTAFPEWALGRGFEVRAALAPATIDAVEIVGADTVKITCRSSLAGLAVTLGYASTTEGKAMDGGGTFRWGHLRDSDPFVGSTTQSAQPNYAVAFQMMVP